MWRSQWTDRYDTRPDPRVPDADATEPAFGDVHTQTVPRARANRITRAIPVDPCKANPHELMRRERRRAAADARAYVEGDRVERRRMVRNVDDRPRRSGQSN